MDVRLAPDSDSAGVHVLIGYAVGKLVAEVRPSPAGAFRSFACETTFVPSRREIVPQGYAKTLTVRGLRVDIGVEVRPERVQMTASVEKGDKYKQD